MVAKRITSFKGWIQNWDKWVPGYKSIFGNSDVYQFRDHMIHSPWDTGVAGYKSIFGNSDVYQFRDHGVHSPWDKGVTGYNSTILTH